MKIKRKIGIFGGSFDPPHLGHIICARTVGEKLDLEKILLIPAGQPPHKPEGLIASSELRFEMTFIMAEEDPLFEVSRIEIDREGISYSVDTLISLLQIYSSDKFDLFWILGYDSAVEFASWKEPETIVQIAQLAVMQRKGYDLKPLPKPWLDRMVIVRTPIIEISSTEIRNRIKNNLPVSSMTGKKVDDVIRKNRLYI